jgi:hypothetical protein
VIRLVALDVTDNQFWPKGYAGVEALVVTPMLDTSSRHEIDRCHSDADFEYFNHIDHSLHARA